MMLRLVAGLALLMMLAVRLQAQAPADSLLLQQLQKAKSGRWIVRVNADTAVARQGVIRAVSDSSLTIADQPVLLKDIALLEAFGSSRKSLRTGAIVGGLLGAGLGGLGAAFGCALDESGDDCTDNAIVIVTLTSVIGAGVGGLFAGFLGSSEWRPLWRR
jgi:hypothetical protein